MRDIAVDTLEATDACDLMSSASSVALPESSSDSFVVSVALSFLLAGITDRPGILLDLSGQSRLRCPCFLHLKHRPSACRRFFSSGVSRLKVPGLDSALFVSATSTSIASGSLSCFLPPLNQLLPGFSDLMRFSRTVPLP